MPLPALAVPAISGVASLVGGLFSANKKKKAEEAQRKLDNQYIAQQDAAKASVLSGLQASGWNPYGVNTLQSGGTESSTQNQRTISRGSRDTSRTTAAEQQPMEEKLRQLVMSRLEQPQQIGAGERMGAVRAFNNSGAVTALKNLAGSRGLSAQQLQSAATPLAVNRANQIATYLGQTVPGRERDLATQARGEASGFLDARAGQHEDTFNDSRMTGSTQGTRTGFSQQGPDIGGALALLSPSGPKQTNQTGTSLLGSALAGAGSLVGNLYSAHQANKKPSTLGFF